MLTPAEAFPLLWQQLRADIPIIEAFNAWFDDCQPLPAVPDDEEMTAYWRLRELASENWAGMIVSAVADRLRLIGMRFNGQVDDGSNELGPLAIWQANGMDWRSDLATLDALIGGRGPIMVTADSDSPVGVRISPEDPRQTIVMYDPGRWAPGGKRAAALKSWVNVEGYGLAEVMVPGKLMKGKTKAKIADQLTTAASWATMGGWDFDMEQDGPKEVPVVELTANARTGRRGRSEMAPHVKALQAINLLGFDMLLAAEFAAYRQRWVTGLDLEYDADGNPKKPFKSGVDRLFVGPATASTDESVKFGEFGESDLTNYIKAIEYKVGSLAARSKTPAHYVATSINNVSADTIRALESGLVAKCMRHQRSFDDPWEDVMRLALGIAGDGRAASDFKAEMIWADPRTHTDGQLADALTKMKAIAVPKQALWGMTENSTPQRVAEWEAMERRNAIMASLLAPPAPPSATPVEPTTPQPAAV